MQLPQLLLVTKVDDQRGWGYQVLPVDIGSRRRAVTSVTIGYQGRWSKRLGLPSYQVTSRYRSYVDVQLPQLLLVTKVDGQRGWGYLVTRLPVDIGRMEMCSYLSYYWLPRWMIKEAGVT